MITQQEIESLGFEYIGGQMIHRGKKLYLKSLGRLWIHLTEHPIVHYAVYEIKASFTEDGIKTTVVHSIRLSTIQELKTLLKQLNLHD